MIFFFLRWNYDCTFDFLQSYTWEADHDALKLKFKILWKDDNRWHKLNKQIHEDLMKKNVYMSAD